MKTLGLCIGASTISFVGLEKTNGVVKMIEQETIFHEGDSKGELVKLLKRIDVDKYDRHCVTGRKFRKYVNLS
ncbi:MAG TPA: hypothetical protein PK900_07735, partial [Spirochaetota bacterium]|nr:hypothetical protein [Spirochaetota bacterium]